MKIPPVHCNLQGYDVFEELARRCMLLQFATLHKAFMYSGQRAPTKAVSFPKDTCNAEGAAGSSTWATAITAPFASSKNVLCRIFCTMALPENVYCLAVE